MVYLCENITISEPLRGFPDVYRRKKATRRWRKETMSDQPVNESGQFCEWTVSVGFNHRRGDWDWCIEIPQQPNGVGGLGASLNMGTAPTRNAAIEFMGITMKGTIPMPADSSHDADMKTVNREQADLTLQQKSTLGGGKVSDELDKIAKAMRSPGLAPERYCQLYAAQQALAWSSGQFAEAPCEVIMSGRVQPLMGTLEG